MDPKIKLMRANFDYLDHSAEELEKLFLRLSEARHLYQTLESTGWKNIILGAPESPTAFHRNRNPFGEWSDQLSEDTAASEICVFFGTGFLYQLPSVLATILSCPQVIIVENQIEALFVMLTEIDLSKMLSEKVRIVFSENGDDVVNRITDKCRRYHPTNISFIPLESYFLHSQAYLEKIARVVRTGWEHHRIYLNSLKKQHRWLIGNTINNLAVEGNYFQLRPDSAGGQRVMVVGSGPSLNAAIPMLRAVADSVHLIAVGSALHPLLSEGICPDLVVVSDPQPINTHHFPEARYDLSLAFDPAVPPDIVHKFNGDYLLFHCGHAVVDIFKTLFGIKSIENWGTVSSSALSLAVDAGFAEIGLVGTDFCFYEDATHAEHYRVRSTSRTSSATTDLLGNQIRSTEILTDYAVYMTKQVRSLTEKGIKIINLCEGGLLQAGEMISQSEYLWRLDRDRRKKTGWEWRQPLTRYPTHDDMRQALRDLLGPALQGLILLKNGEISMNQLLSQTLLATLEGTLIEELSVMETAMISANQTEVQKQAELIAARLKTLTLEIIKMI